MKFKHKCEYNGCNKSATRRIGNKHWVCDDCFKHLNRKKRDLGHNIFVKEVFIGSYAGMMVYGNIGVKY